MKAEEITKEQFLKFIRLRNSGLINMHDIVTGANIINESEEVYETIMWNFSYLKQKFSNL